jgi:hypothetical protein
MKNKIVQFLMSVVLTVGFSAFANAQTHRTTIPFNFIVGDQSFRAGEYTVNFGVSAVKNVLLLRSADGKRSAIISRTVSKNSDRNLKQTSFVFYVTDGHYYLAEVNTARQSVELRGLHLKNKPTTTRYEIALAR